MTLDELAAEPQRMAGLSRQERRTLLYRANALLTGLLIFEATDEPEADPPDELLTIDEAAARLKMHPKTLYKQRHKYRGAIVDTGTRNIRFSARRLTAMLEKRVTRIRA